MATLTLVPMSVPTRTRTVLTRRGRRTLGAAVAAMVFVLAYLVSGLVGGLLGGAVQGSTQPGQSIPTVKVVVQPGQTLWQLAKTLDPAADPRALVDRITQLNGLADGQALLAGQTLLVPAL